MGLALAHPSAFAEVVDAGVRVGAVEISLVFGDERVHGFSIEKIQNEHILYGQIHTSSSFPFIISLV